MNCQTGKYIQNQSKNKPYHSKERLISYQFHVLEWFIYVLFDHTFPCCIVVKNVNCFNVGNFCLEFRRRIRQETGWHKLRVAHKNIIMTRDERWKVDLFTAHPRWFIYRSVSSSSHQNELQRSPTSCKVLRSLELAHRIYYSVDRIFVIVLLSMHPIWFVDSVYSWSQLHQK